jgi:hypothetical protein
VNLIELVEAGDLAGVVRELSELAPDQRAAQAAPLAARWEGMVRTNAWHWLSPAELAPQFAAELGCQVTPAAAAAWLLERDSTHARGGWGWMVDVADLYTEAWRVDLVTRLAGQTQPGIRDRSCWVRPGRAHHPRHRHPAADHRPVHRSLAAPPWTAPDLALLHPMASTPAENAAMARDYLALLDRSLPEASCAQEVLTGLDEAGLLEPDVLTEMCERVLLRPEKKLVRAQLPWLDQVLGDEPREDAVQLPWKHSCDPSLAGALLAARLTEVIDIVERSIQPFLLAVPTLATGALDAAVLVERIAQLEELGITPRRLTWRKRCCG